MAAEKPKPQQRYRFDVDAAKARYIALGPLERSFERISREFGVSSVTVRKHARRGDWVQAAADADQGAALRVQREAVRTVEERAVKNARIHDRTADRLDDRVEDLDDQVLVRLHEVTGKWARLDSGQATEMVSFQEAQEALGLLMSLGVQAIRERWSPQQFLESARGRLGAIEQERDAA